MSRYNLSDSLSLVLYALLIVVSLTFGCGRGVLVGKDVAVRTLEAQGFTEIQVTDNSWFAVGWRGCDQNDAARLTAVAKNPAGKKVTVYVCAGFFKGGTIRTP